MILKSLSRKTKSYKSLLKYMFSDASNGIVLKKSIQSNSISEWILQFKDNECNRRYIRHNNSRLIHEIISFNRKDNEHITNAKLKDIGNKFLKLRGDSIMAIGTIHKDKEHFHLHFMISSVNIHTGLSARICKQRFKEIKEELQKYHIEKYPELIYSVVNHSKKGKSISEKEFQLIKRSKHATEKESLKELIATLYAQSTSKEDFYRKIEQAKLKTYTRNGIVCGVISKRKFRFSNLGITIEKLLALDKVAELQRLRKNIHTKEQGLGR